MVTMETKTLSQIHSQLMQDILACDNQILGEDEFDQNEYDLTLNRCAKNLALWKKP